MRLVVCFTVGDGYTYSCDTVLPFEYDSAEQLLEDIEILVNAQLKFTNDRAAAFAALYKKQHRMKEEDFNAELSLLYNKFPYQPEIFKIVSGDSELHVNNLLENGKYFPPNIFTIDEWFDYNNIS